MSLGKQSIGKTHALHTAIMRRRQQFGLNMLNSQSAVTYDAYSPARVDIVPPKRHGHMLKCGMPMTMTHGTKTTSKHNVKSKGNPDPIDLVDQSFARLAVDGRGMWAMQAESCNMYMISYQPK